MWLCFNTGFVSAVQHRDRPDELVVRARRREILEELFPALEVVVGGSTDYNYRVFISKKEFSAIVAKRIEEISYPNFKDSVVDNALHKLYAAFWSLHYQYQR